MIPVTKSFLPPIKEYQDQIARIWESHWVTNRGPLVLDLEAKLKLFLDIPNIIVTNNGTVPLQIGLKLLGNGGEIITTPFSYVATTAAVVWENCKPIFVDVDPLHLTIDETKVEAAITDKTTAILATHVFGNPCNVDVIGKIAEKYNLHVIYDAAHCFGVKFNGQSVFRYGDISTCSFHATKLFHCGEGGAMFTNSQDLHHKLFYNHNFGHNGPLDFFGLGINGKISELQAAMGLSVLSHMDTIVAGRKRVVDYYNNFLNFNGFTGIKLRENTDWNYSYFPVVFESNKKMLKVQEELNKAEIFPRRYFYPSLNTIEYCKSIEMPISERIADSILCLPLYDDLDESDQEIIVNIINKIAC